jgi:hypothetical protein
MFASHGKKGKDHWSHWLCVKESRECTDKQFTELWAKRDKADAEEVIRAKKEADDKKNGGKHEPFRPVINGEEAVLVDKEARRTRNAEANSYREL